MPLYSAALKAATSWGTAVAPGANDKVPILSESWKETPAYIETREEVPTSVHDRGEVKRAVRAFRSCEGDMWVPGYYSALHPALRAAFGNYSEVIAAPVTQRTYGTATASPSMLHSVGLNRRDSTWQVDTAIVRALSIGGDVGKQLRLKLGMLGHLLSSGSSFVPSTWTFEGGNGILGLPIIFTSAAAEFLVAPFSTTTALNSSNAKALSRFDIDLAYDLLGGVVTEAEGDKAGVPAWERATLTGTLQFNRYDADIATWAASQTRLMAKLTLTGPIKSGGVPYVFRLWLPRLKIEVGMAASGPGMIKPEVRFRGEYGMSTTADQAAGFPSGQEGRSSLLVEAHI